MKMNRLFLVTILILTNCTEHENQSKKSIDTPTKLSSDSSPKSLDTTIVKNTAANLAANKAGGHDAHNLNCDELLFLLVKTSSFNPEIKKFPFKVLIDESSEEGAILKITMRNTERNEDLVISWLKIEIKEKKLLDITIDPEKPVELNYDRSLFNKVVDGCKFGSVSN